MSSATMGANSAAPVLRLLQINVAVLVAMSGTIFACAEGAPAAAWAVPIAWVGLMFVDLRPLLRVNSWVANGLALAVIAAVGFEYFGNTIESRLLAFGHFLCYLSWVLLLQEKKSRQFWWLCALSVLQVATSAVLTSSPWLGLALIVYVTYALLTLSVFSLYRAVSRSAGVEQRTSPDSGSGGPPGSVSRNAVRLESAAKWITPRFFGGVAVNGVMSITLGLLIFVLTPRIWIGQIGVIGGRSLPSARSVTGVSEDVDLGDVGEIMENPDLIMEVQFSDMSTGKAMSVEEFLEAIGAETPLYRGIALDEYSSGHWSMGDIGDTQLPNLEILDSRRHFYQQSIRLRPTGISALFVGPGGVTCRPLQPRMQITHERLRNTFHREASKAALRSETFEYQAYSLGPDEQMSFPSSRSRTARYQQRMSRFPPGLKPVRELAEQTVRVPGEDPLPPAEAARRLVARLRDSGEYGYSLDTTPDDPMADPIVDFLANRKEGHCEFFASSLALMLRAVGIPSRLVTGFKGGAFNENTQFYEIRQLHAHAWVEAFVDNKWVVLDPTPAVRDQTVSANAASSHFWTDLVTKAKDLWMRGMLFSGSQQQRMFVDPLQKSAGGLFSSFTEIGSELGTGFEPDQRRANSRDSALWAVLLVMGMLALIIAGTIAGMRLVGKRIRGKGRRARSAASVAGPPVPFYERFCAILARNGRVREPAQTQREFATTLGDGWKLNGSPALGSDRPGNPLRDSVQQDRVQHDRVQQDSNLPENITTAFYRIRFGRHQLPAGELRALDASLDRWEQSLSNGNPGNGSAR